MGAPNPILNASNEFLVVTNLPIGSASTFGELPLGTVGASATGELGVKVISVGSGTGASSTTVQGTAADNAVAVGNPVYTGGLAVTSSTYSPAYTAGDAAALAVDKTTGALITSKIGGKTLANGQVATSGTAGTLVAANLTRRSVTVKNLDTTITVYIGVATVSAANGMPLKAGESISVDTTALIQVIAASGTPTVAYLEVSD